MTNAHHTTAGSTFNMMGPSLLWRSQPHKMRYQLPKPIVFILCALALNGSAVFALHQAARTTTRIQPRTTSSTTKKAFYDVRASCKLKTCPSSIKKIKQSPLFQSSECAEIELGTTSGWKDTVGENLSNLRKSAAIARRRIPILVSAATQATIDTIQKCWWCLPMILALVPPYFALVHRTNPKMPSFWPLVQLDAVSAVILGGFLLSNIAYFISGIYLYLRYHHLVPSTSDDESKDLHPTRDPLLGGSVLAAGTVSTIFHSVQALGSQALAECLCFIDHGVAISSILYFWFRCGRPSQRTWALSLVGLTTLSITANYAWLHSAWHFLSASAAVVWARDGFGTKAKVTI